MKPSNDRMRAEIRGRRAETFACWALRLKGWQILARRARVPGGEVDVIAGYTSDGWSAKYDLVALQDPKRAIPPYDAILLLAPKRAGDERLQAALKPLLGKIDIATMREANLRASGNDANSSPDAVAKWLWGKIR